jgi:hypothetical protein
MEDRDASQLKLVLCGSYIGQMERLLSGPLRGRLTATSVEPLGFTDALAYMTDRPAAVRAIERYAVAGGMGLYLDELARAESLPAQVCTRVLNPFEIAGVLGEHVSPAFEALCRLWVLATGRATRVRFAARGPTIVLFTKSGFSKGMLAAVDGRDDVVLVDAGRLVGDLAA